MRPAKGYMQTFNYERAHSAERAPFPREFMRALADTNQFFRNKRSGVVLFAPEPGSFVPVIRADEFRSIVESGEVLLLTGDALTPDDWRALWFTVTITVGACRA